MIGAFRNFAKTKFAGILVFIMIIPFVFWGMGGIFQGGNTNNVAKINNNTISVTDFINHVNESGLRENLIRENIDKNIFDRLIIMTATTKTFNIAGAHTGNVIIPDENLRQKFIFVKQLGVNMNCPFHQEMYV